MNNTNTTARESKSCSKRRHALAAFTSPKTFLPNDIMERCIAATICCRDALISPDVIAASKKLGRKNIKDQLY